jgi:hypothetical protein
VSPQMGECVKAGLTDIWRYATNPDAAQDRR